MNFVSIDFETANNSLYSACAIGAVAHQNLEITKEESYLIKPPMLHRKLNEENYNIHKIKYSSYIKADRFFEVWRKLEKKIDSFNDSETIFICFNAIFDLSVLLNLLKKYKIDINYKFYDPMEIEKNIWSDKESYSLKNLCIDHNIELDHHNPLSDAKAGGQLAIAQMKELKVNSLSEVIDKLNLNIITTNYKDSSFNNHYDVTVPAATNFLDIKKKY